jgi:hypothetical protein
LRDAARKKTLHKQTLKRRILAGTFGFGLLLATLGETGFVSYVSYVDRYWMPMDKYGIRYPLRWQDIVFIVLFYAAMIGLVYLAFRLLRYALRREPVASD